MGRKSRTGLMALAAVMLASSALAKAAPKCATADEVSAIQAAAIQQQLMVAALTCDQITNFNQFQVGFGPELRASDARLERMFKRMFGAGTGEAQYHAFKTRLANDSSINSIHDNTTYCHTASTVFEAALAPAKPRLADFVAGIPVTEASPVNSCEIRVAGGLAGAPAEVMVPRPNPYRLMAMTTPAPMVAPAPAAVTPPPPPPPAAAPQPAPDGDKKDDDKKSGSWLSGIFGH
ncbi:MAG TPA: hypothetical protein VGG48_16185 [Rhizomicrobium sp.]